MWVIQLELLSGRLAGVRVRDGDLLPEVDLPVADDEEGRRLHTVNRAGEGASYGANVDKLLRELAPCQDRRAQFRSVMVLALPDGREIVAEGAIDGEIAPARRGERGFGYDPVFIPDGGGGRTFAEMSAAEKDSLGHRGRALRALRRELERVGITSL